MIHARRPLIAIPLCLLTAACSQRTHPIRTADIDHELKTIESQRLAACQQTGASTTPCDSSLRTQDSGLITSTFSLTSVDTDTTPATQKSRASATAAPSYKPPLSGFFETVHRDVHDMPHDLWHDTKRVYGNPINLAILGVTYGGSLALQESGPDDTVEHHYNHHHTMNKGWRDAFDAIGNPGTHFAIAGAWYLLGQQTHNDKTYEVAKTLGSALIINGVTVILGQAASADKAPNGKYGTFPSGHTSSSFCIASVMDEAYGHVVGIPLYGVATMVGIQRLDAREHYFSDVVMGAVLGTVIGHSVASGRDPEFFGWKILPYADPNSGASGIALAKEFH